jgi:hypothetical protein
MIIIMEKFSRKPMYFDCLDKSIPILPPDSEEGQPLDLLQGKKAT